MKSKLLTKNISLDTSFIEAQNFLAGSKMNELSDLCKEGHITLHITNITYREVIARFRKNIIQTEEKIKKPKGILEDHARILRNFPDFNTYFELPAIDIEAICLRFIADFDTWLAANKVVIIPTDHLNIKEVFEDYFSNKAPFKDGKKKHEFPDAFSLKALSEYFQKTRGKTYLIATDPDILNFSSKTIIPFEDSAALLDLVIRNTPKKLTEKAIKLIEKEFISSKFILEKDVIEKITSLIEDEFGSIGEFDDLEIDCADDIDISDIEFENFSIVHLDINSQTGKLECKINFAFEVSFTANDLSEGWYDNEEHKWHFVEPKTFYIKDTYDIPITITATFDVEDEIVTLEVEEINYGRKLDIFSSFKRRGY